MIHICAGLTTTDTEIYKTLKDMQPKKWAIERTSVNHKEVNAWVKIQGYDLTCDYGWIYSEPVDKTAQPLFTIELAPGFTEITIEQFREITNPTKSKTMNKAQLIEKLKERIYTTQNTDIAKAYNEGIKDALFFIKQLPEDGEITHGKPDIDSAIQLLKREGYIITKQF